MALSFTEEGRSYHQKMPVIFTTGLSKENGFTLEVLIKSGNNHHSGHARILSYSQNKSLRNFTLAQSSDKLIIRLRTTNTDLNAIKPHIKIPDVFNRKELHHIIVTYNFRETRVYIDRKLRLCDDTLAGSFKNWDPSYKLVIGNEADGSKPWLGEIFYAAIYDRAVSEKEIQSKFHSNPLLRSLPEIKSPADETGTVVRYLFNERKGINVSDSGAGNLRSVDLYIPETLPKKEHILGLSKFEILNGLKNVKDIIFNVILFMPLGFLIYFILVSRSLGHSKTFLYTILIGLSISIRFEYLQCFIHARVSSIVDVFSNVIGLWVGIAAYLLYSIRFYSQDKS